MTTNQLKKIGMISHSVIEKDPRVRKFCETLMAHGYVVQSVGLAGDPDQDVFPWEHFPISLDAVFEGNGLLSRVHYYGMRAFGLRLFPQKWDQVFWQFQPAYKAMLETAKKHMDADIWIATDWEMLPLASALKAAKGGSIIYDSHEHATEQFLGHSDWRLMTRPLVCAVEGAFVRDVEAILSVSDGICTDLYERYSLPVKPISVRNMPRYVTYPFRPVGEHVELLYQGLVGPYRGLEPLIESAKLWDPRFHLTIRGPINAEGYGEKLEMEIKEAGVGARCTLKPPVAPHEMLDAAHAADIGLMLLTAKAKQSDYALPNKIYEYMMAGLALGVSNHSEMAREVSTYGGGIVLESADPVSLATQINSWSNSMINQHKQNALVRARQACWENEQTKLLDTIERLV